MEADLDRMAALSFNSFRTSISWSRLIPEGTGKLIQKLLTFIPECLMG